MIIQDTIRSLRNTSNADDKFRIIADVLDALNPNAVAVLPTVNTYVQTGINPPTYALVTPGMVIPVGTPIFVPSNPGTNPPTYVLQNSPANNVNAPATYIQTGNNPPTFALVTPQMNVPANTPLYIQSNPATNPPTYIPLQ